AHLHIHHAEPLLIHESLERVEGLGVGCKCDAEISSAGTAYLVRYPIFPGMGADAPMLGGHDVRADCAAQILQSHSILDDRVDEALPLACADGGAAGRGDGP